MKLKILWAVALFSLSGIAAAQKSYEILPDENNADSKILKGLINKQLLIKDTVYNKWYAENQKIYTRPDSAIINSLERNKGKVSYIIFGGTWCEDTQFILPKFFILQEKAGVPDDDITFFGVTRKKQTMGNISSAFKILNVPTIIVMKEGKEIGRVVEYGKTGKWDKELADILNQ